MLKHFIAIAVAVLLSQTVYSQTKPRPAMYTDYTAIVEDKCAIFLHGGSMMHVLIGKIHMEKRLLLKR